jgi:hypothetical protein
VLLRIGIGVGVGALIGLGIVTLKQFQIWPFNSKRKTAKQTVDKALGTEEEVSTASRKLRRRHPRSWNVAYEFTPGVNLIESGHSYFPYSVSL